MIIILYRNNVHFILILILVKIISNINHNNNIHYIHNNHNHNFIILAIVVIPWVSRIAIYYKNHKIIQNKIRIIVIVIIVNLKINIIWLMKLKILINRYLGCIKLVEYDNNQITTIITITLTITIILINKIHIDKIVVYYPHHKIPQTIIKQNIHNINNIYHHHYHHNLLFYI
jgi:hypothetical protein